jgi:hypothetical protein
VKPSPHRFSRGALRHVLVVLAVAFWIGAVVYPDPRPFVTSLARLKNPPVDAQAVAGIAAGLPRDYKTIEDFSLQYVVYKPAWTVYGLPWYFPTVSEAVRDRAGDCQARAIIAASIFEAKGMPYTLRYSFDHVWVDYPGKQFADMEDPATSFVADSGKGWLASLPDRIPLGSIVKVRIAYHWTPMPLAQKIILLMGSLLIIGYGERRLLRRMGRAVRPRRSPFVRLPSTRTGIRRLLG